MCHFNSELRTGLQNVYNNYASGGGTMYAPEPPLVVLCIRCIRLSPRSPPPPPLVWTGYAPDGIT